MRLAIALMMMAVPLAAQPVAAPAGWTVAHSGANWVYTPANVASFVLTIEPVQSLAGQDVSQWLLAQVQSDVTRHGALIGTPAPQRAPAGVTIVQASYRDFQGARWVALYTAALRADGKAQLSTVATSLTGSSATEYVRTAGTIIGALDKAQQQVASAPASDGNVVAVLHEGRGQTTATGYQFIESADVLLKDGWAYLGATVPPEYLDEATSKQREPSKWHRWKSAGADILVESDGKYAKLDAERVRPLPAGAAMSITMTHRNSTSFGGMGSYNTSGTITLTPDGHYQRSSGVIAGTGVVQSGGGFSGGAGSYENQNERRSSAAGGNGTVTATTRSRGTGDANLAGTYRVTGYTLELDGAGGSVQRVLAFYPFPDNDRVYIGGVTYNREKR